MIKFSPFRSSTIQFLVILPFRIGTTDISKKSTAMYYSTIEMIFQEKNLIFFKKTKKWQEKQKIARNFLN